MSDAASPRIALLGLPFDANSSFLRGTAQAPPLIRQALYCDSSNLWTESGTDLGQEGLIVDAGDLPISISRAEEAFESVTETVGTLLQQGLKPIALGGDHSLTYAVVRGVARLYPRLNILHFDAHPDLYDEFAGSRFSHACPFARIMEEKLAARLVQVGIRTMNGHQREQAERFGVELIEMRALRDDQALQFDSPVYISFDLDALDPAFAPGVSHPEPAGLSMRQAVTLIQNVRAPHVVGADIVEYNPARDPQEFASSFTPVSDVAPAIPSLTAMTAAKILKEIAARLLV